MRKRIRCLWHAEATASLVQLKNGWFCYGACHKLYTNKEVEEKTGEHYEYIEEDGEPTDLVEEFGYINSLPKQEIRGLKFPSDERGYYICWPGDSYYKYRLHNPGKGSKYLGPKGHYPPLFWARVPGSQTLTVVEGEINALSIARACEEGDICSPGSASMFNADNLSKYLHIFRQYSNVLVVLDDDAAGMRGLIEAKAFLLYKIPFITFIQMKPDANEILQTEGTDGLRKALQRCNRR